MKNKNRQHDHSKNAVKQVNTDSQAKETSGNSIGVNSGSKLHVSNPMTNLVAVESKVIPSRETGTSGQTLSVDTAPIKPGRDVSNQSGFDLNRAEKQKLRLLKKLNERDEGAAGRKQQKRNYVDRASSLTGGRVGKWKDYACVFFVILAIVAAGLLRVQEEVFGSVDHLRQESDSDYYEILGIPHAASMRDIKKAYRDKVLEIHPDHHPECSDCQERFIASTKAYNTLVNTDQRKVYDESRGSYDPILSDFSVSLTWFNYEKLVVESSAVWVIQVYDDLDASSKHFAQQWDGVAGSDLTDLGGIKFGRVNARRDRDLLSRLPMRTRTYPTVMLFTRDTMPSIFSLADTSTKALRKWVISETPFIQSNTNLYKLVVQSPEVSLRIKSASVQYSRVFDFEWKSGTGPVKFSLVNKAGISLATVQLGSAQCEDVFACIETLKLRLLVPVTRYNIGDVCENSIGPVHCVYDKEDREELLTAPVSDEDVQMQRITLASRKSFILDFAGSQISFDVNNGFDPNFAPIHRDEFIDQILPKTILDTVMGHSKLLIVVAMLAGAGIVLTRVGPVQITAGVLGFSLLVGLLNQPIVSRLVERLIR